MLEAVVRRPRLPYAPLTALIHQRRGGRGKPRRSRTRRILPEVVTPRMPWSGHVDASSRTERTVGATARVTPRMARPTSWPRFAAGTASIKRTLTGKRSASACSMSWREVKRGPSSTPIHRRFGRWAFDGRAMMGWFSPSLMTVLPARSKAERSIMERWTGRTWRSPP